MPDFLAIYLNEHLAGSAGGVALARRIAGSRAGAEADEARRLADDIAADRDTLATILQRLGIRRTFYKESVALAAERVSRFKLNGTLARHSPLSDVVEYEALATGITGKRAAWRTLRRVAATREGLDEAELDGLIRRADEQLDAVERLRTTAVGRAFDAA